MGHGIYKARGNPPPFKVRDQSSKQIKRFELHLRIFHSTYNLLIAGLYFSSEFPSIHIYFIIFHLIHLPYLPIYLSRTPASRLCVVQTRASIHSGRKEKRNTDIPNDAV